VVARLAVMAGRAVRGTLRREARMNDRGKSDGRDLRVNLEDLLRRVHSGAYRASPSRRVYIPKPDGRKRPLGIATLEDKIVQRAMVEVLNAVYEEDFLGFSYGFRPGRKPHDALDALAVGIDALEALHEQRPLLPLLDGGVVAGGPSAWCTGGRAVRRAGR
jgi:hypothetical protein